MKTCLICGAVSDDKAESCASCGECSFAVAVPARGADRLPPSESVTVSVQPVQCRRNRR